MKPLHSLTSIKSGLRDIANARQIFQNKVFFSLPGEVFLIKKKKKVFSEKFAGRQQY
jgi:hypothetical protein